MMMCGTFTSWLSALRGVSHLKLHLKCMVEAPVRPWLWAFFLSDFGTKREECSSLNRIQTRILETWGGIENYVNLSSQQAPQAGSDLSATLHGCPVTWRGTKETCLRYSEQNTKNE